MSKITKIITLFLMIIIILKEESYPQTEVSTTITTYYPSPAGDFLKLKVNKKISVGTSPSYFDQLPDGTIYLERGTVLKKWEETLPSGNEGELIYYYSSEGGKFSKNKLYFFDGKNWQELLSIPDFTTKILVWVDTSVANVTICGKPAAKRTWVECTLAPDIKDTDKGGCNRVSIWRDCSKTSCIVRRGGSYYGSPWGKVCFRVPDKDDFSLNYSPSDARCYRACCSSSPSASCSVGNPKDPADCWSFVGGKYKHQICIYGGCWCGCYLCDCCAGPGISLTR